MTESEEIKALALATAKIIGSRKFKMADPEVEFLRIFIQQTIDNFFDTFIASSGNIKSNKEKVTQVTKGFAAVKLGIQEAISVAFQASMERISKRSIEYYCTIMPVPEAPSDKAQ